eukprot:TRINITY_DN1799_c0_g2_i16.p1 TRINITY_DN1799_c0_g2~~TRINITY_DN1799_c0_g2_i16.p1  ORF type:complete len:515 (-),score=129.32 TRINITY_DN1799_c0_g2_i16:1774-3318(-)
MTQKQIVISRFCLGGRSFYFHTHWNVEDFSVTITDGKYAWHGQADSEYIEETLKPKGMEMEEYLLLTKEALTTQDLEKKKFSYGLQQGSNSSEIKLVWNIRLNTDSTLPEDFFMKGVLSLNRVENVRGVVQSKLDYLITKLRNCEEENTELKRVNKLMTSQRQDAINQFDQLIIEKQCIETEMFAKFVEVLNEKKKKIRDLKENLKKNRHTQIPSLGTLDPDPEDEVWVHSQLQTGESQMTPLITTPSMASVNGPTPSLELLKDDHEDKFEPVVRKRFRSVMCNSDTDTKTTSSSSCIAPSLGPSGSHGIIILDPSSPAPKVVNTKSNNNTTATTTAINTNADVPIKNNYLVGVKRKDRGNDDEEQSPGAKRQHVGGHSSPFKTPTKRERFKKPGRYTSSTINTTTTTKGSLGHPIVAANKPIVTHGSPYSPDCISPNPVTPSPRVGPVVAFTTAAATTTTASGPLVWFVGLHWSPTFLGPFANRIDILTIIALFSSRDGKLSFRNFTSFQLPK